MVIAIMYVIMKLVIGMVVIVPVSCLFAFSFLCWFVWVVVNVHGEGKPSDSDTVFFVRIPTSQEHHASFFSENSLEFSKPRSVSCSARTFSFSFRLFGWQWMCTVPKTRDNLSMPYL